jgi:hypothetical protein
MMRCRLALCSLSLAMLLAAGGAGIAQTATSAAPASPNSAALRKEDRVECNKEAARLLVPRAEKANFVRNCMADRQGERKADAKAKAK